MNNARGKLGKAVVNVNVEEEMKQKDDRKVRGTELCRSIINCYCGAIGKYTRS